MVLTYMEKCGYSPGISGKIPLNEMHNLYKIEYPNGVSIRDFSRQLRSLGYDVKRAGKNNTVSVYLAQCKAEDSVE